jgi:hypothetical protein
MVWHAGSAASVPRQRETEEKAELGRFEAAVSDILAPAGIKVNGPNPWDIQVKDERFYGGVMRDGSLGLGESYMDGWWECTELDTFFTKLIPTDPEAKIKRNPRLLMHERFYRMWKYYLLSSA